MKCCIGIVLAWILALTPGAAVLSEEEICDGIYRGFYYDGGIEQIAIQFELKDGLFDSIVYRGIKYKDGDYLSEDASDAQKAIRKQYMELADYLIGKGVEAIDDLYSPYGFVEDVDAVTSATFKSSKLISALWDGIKRRPYKIVGETKLPEAPPCQDGIYRGSYMEDGVEEVNVEFEVRDGRFVSLSYRALQYKHVNYLSPDADARAQAVASQFRQVLGYLEGKEIACVNDLYQPGEIADDTDATTAATLRTPKLISALWDGISRNAYERIAE